MRLTAPPTLRLSEETASPKIARDRQLEKYRRRAFPSPVRVGKSSLAGVVPAYRKGYRPRARVGAPTNRHGPGKWPTIYRGPSGFECKEESQLDVSEDHRAFDRIIGRLEDPEDRLDRRAAFRGYAIDLLGFLIVLASYLSYVSVPAIGLGVLLMAFGNVLALSAIGRVLVRRSMWRRDDLVWDESPM